MNGPAAASRWSDLRRRLASALVLLPVTLFCIWSGGYWFLTAVSLASAILSWEWLGMAGISAPKPAWFWFPACMVAVTVMAGLGAAAAGLSMVAIATTAAVWTPAASGRFDLPFGAVYLGLPVVALSWLRDDQAAGLANTVFVLAIVWGSDIGAYLAGRLIGGPKLAPSISPGKTWSGGIGGLASAAAAGLAAAACLSPRYSPLHVIGLAVVFGVIAQAGDLVESALKRHFGVKDSGRIIPGHGGLLDRVDALLAVAPVAALLALSVGRGVVLWR